MTKLVLHGYISTSSIDDVGKPLTKEVDGPSQVGSFNQLAMGVGYPSGTVIAQTWNDGLALEYGRQLGREAAAIGVDGLYAPSVNIHRTPLGGRNYEYFSEDPLVAGNLAAAVVAGAKQTGTYCYIKHLALNNQDSYRDSLYEWLTEQTLREIYLRPFKLAIEKGGATGLMSAYNRIGATWAGGNKALLTGVLREEWGFEGAVITDYADHQQYMNADQMLRAGGDLFMDGVFRNGQFKYGFSAEELSVCERIRERSPRAELLHESAPRDQGRPVCVAQCPRLPGSGLCPPRKKDGRVVGSRVRRRRRHRRARRCRRSHSSPPFSRPRVTCIFSLSDLARKTPAASGRLDWQQVFSNKKTKNAA